MQAWYDAEDGKLDPFVLILEGSLPQREDQRRRLLDADGRQPDTGQPITTNEWIDRLAPKAAAVVAVGTCATYGGIPAMKNNPTGAMGLGDYLGWNWKSKAGIPIVNIPGCPAQPDNITETLMYLVLRARRAGAAARARRRRRGRSGCSSAPRTRAATARLLRGGQLRDGVRLRPPLPGQARLQGPGGQVQRAAARLGQRHRRLPERRRHLHGLHDAGLPRQVHAVHGRGPDGRGLRATSRSSPTARSCAAVAQAQHQAQVRQGARVAAQPPELTTGYAKRW